MYTKNGKVILEPMDIPCRHVMLVPDPTGGISGCFSPDCKLGIGLQRLGGCAIDCEGYRPEEVLECQKHGQYIASHGCLLCDVEGGKKNV